MEIGGVSHVKGRRRCLRREGHDDLVRDVAIDVDHRDVSDLVLKRRERATAAARLGDLLAPAVTLITSCALKGALTSLWWAHGPSQGLR
jgi:hypothetical protein